MPTEECAVCYRGDGLVACWLCGALVCASAADWYDEFGFSPGGCQAIHVASHAALVRGGRP